jgi:tRNA-dihydrouridine synthase A
MMDWTDRHCRYFHRLLAPSALLYTEMVTTGALLHGDHERFLAYNPEEHPLALQLGGSDPGELAQCARMAAQWGYDEVNLNVGCPSDRVQKGRFGACLMKEPALVRECLAAMVDAVDIPVTVKCRLGVDDLYSYDYFRGFVSEVVASGAHALVAHARIALLQGLSPKENRDVPPLHHDWVHRLKQELPGLPVTINGGIDSLALVEHHLQQVNAVMLGRAAYQRPWLLAECQARLHGPGSAPATAAEVVPAMTAYLQQQVAQGVAVKHITRHVLGLFSGQPGARLWRRYIAEHAHLDDRNAGVLEQALQAMTAVSEVA